MELVLILILGAVIYGLRQRVGALEVAVQELEWSRLAAEPTVVSEQPASGQSRDPVKQPHRVSPPALAPRPPIGGSVRSGEQPIDVSFPEEVGAEETHLGTGWGRAVPSFDLEDLFGRLLPIWAGGITLAVAGFFMVRYSIEAGLLTDVARVLLGFAFGLALIGGAEVARRWQDRVSDPRVAQALAGAGIATLYASFYLAGSFYDLITPLAAFVGLAGVTGAAVALSYRFGIPSAALGLVGGFATPLLSGGTEANVPLLTLYLTLTAGGLMASARHRRWAWLGLSAVAGGLLWGLFLVASGIGDSTDIAALGLFTIAAGVLLPAFLPSELGKYRWIAEAGAAVVAAIEMALLVRGAEHSSLGWGLFALLLAALAVLGWRTVTLRRASAFAGVLVPLLLIDWPTPDAATYASFTAVFAALLAGVPLALVWLRRGNALDHGQIAVGSLGLFAAFLTHGVTFGESFDNLIAVFGLLLAALPALAAWRLWPAEGEAASAGMVGLSASAMLLILIAVSAITPEWSHAITAAVLATAWLALARRRADKLTALLGWGSAVLSAGILALHSGVEVDRLAGVEGLSADPLGAIRWVAVTCAFASLAFWEYRPARRVAEAAAAVFAYGAVAQLLPAAPLAWLAAFGAVVTALAMQRRIALQLTFVIIAAFWALEPTGYWLHHGLLAVIGTPMLSTGVPGLRDVLLHMLPIACAATCVFILQRYWLGDRMREAVLGVVAIVLIPLHAIFKHAMALVHVEDFVRIGLVERTVWEAALILLGWAAWRVRENVEAARYVGAAFAGAGLLHWLYFSLLQSNPLWALQSVGSLPMLNMLLPLYAIGLGAVLWASRPSSLVRRAQRTALDTAAMVLIALLSFSELRQFFAGALLVEGNTGEIEGLLRSLLGIVLAIGFLLWGARRGLRSWRIGSLVLMVLAVGKVFLVDAAGLEGIARIVSFVALGFSLIGIGWFYSRQLRSPVSEGERA